MWQELQSVSVSTVQTTPSAFESEDRIPTTIVKPFARVICQQNHTENSIISGYDWKHCEMHLTNSALLYFPVANLVILSKYAFCTVADNECLPYCAVALREFARTEYFHHL